MNPAIAEDPGRWNFEQLLENLPAGAYMCDAAGLITYFNRHAVRVWGREPQLRDPLDRFCGSFRLFASDGTPLKHEECWMALALKNNREYNGCEIVIERADGSRATVLAHANPIRDDAGKLLGAVNVLVDITAQKLHERTLQALKDELDQRVEELQEADRLKDEFLATLAHELRNPLAPIRNALHIMRLSGDHSPSGDRMHEIMERQVTQLVRLVDDLMEVSRVSRGKIDLRLERVELAAIIRQAVETSRPLIDANDHQLAISLPADLLLLSGDPLRLAQVISNLLSNAARYTEPGGQIWLTARRNGNEVTISVRDTGKGIPPEMLSRVFEMFVQVDPGLNHQLGGLGIGLTLAKRLTELHGGRIEAKSDGKGQGSEFLVHLPLAAGEEHKTPPAVNSRPANTLAQRKILVVDDNRDAADSLATLLRCLGAEVRTAYSGPVALEAVESFQPAIVLLDLGMPEMDGYTVARELRNWQRQSHPARVLRIVALTGWGQEGHRRRTAESGFDHHLVKPVDPEVLEALLMSFEPDKQTNQPIR